MKLPVEMVAHAEAIRADETESVCARALALMVLEMHATPSPAGRPALDAGKRQRIVAALIRGEPQMSIAAAEQVSRSTVSKVAAEEKERRQTA